MADALGPTKTTVLPTFHALTGANVTRRFSGKGKATCWDEFDKGTPILQALANLSCGNSQMTAQEVEWNSWFVGCTNQRQTSKLSKPSDGPSLRKSS